MVHSRVSKNGPVWCCLDGKVVYLAVGGVALTDRLRRRWRCLDQSGEPVALPASIFVKSVCASCLPMQRRAQIHNLVDGRAAGGHVHPDVLIDARDAFAQLRERRFA